LSVSMGVDERMGALTLSFALTILPCDKVMTSYLIGHPPSHLVSFKYKLLHIITCKFRAKST
jgi:hypothetical protein